jgi:hypothetical protein
VTSRAQLGFWGVPAPRVLAIAPSRSRTFSENNFGEAPKVRAGLALHARRVRLPDKKNSAAWSLINEF